MVVYLVTSSDREHGGTRMHGVFSTLDLAYDARDAVNRDFYRVASVEPMQVDLALKVGDEEQ